MNLQNNNSGSPQHKHPLLSRQPVSFSDSAIQGDRMARAEMVVEIVEHHETILNHLLFWLQDHPFYRGRWHRRTTEMTLFDESVLLDLDGLLHELEDVRQQYPFGYAPEKASDARQFQGRLALLKCELENFRRLCDHYLLRIGRKESENDLP